MQAGPGRDLVVARAVIVAAAVIQIPVQGGRGIAFALHPLLQGDGVERLPGRILRRRHGRKDEDALAIVAMRLAQTPHLGKEAFMLRQFRRRHAFGGNEAVLPVAVEQQSLFRSVQDVALVVIWLFRLRIALDNPQVEQDLSHMGRFGRRQRQVMATGRIGQVAEVAAGRVAIRLRAIDHEKIPVPQLVQTPGGRQARDAGAEDGHVGRQGACRRRQRRALAQQLAQIMPLAAARIQHLGRDFLPAQIRGDAADAGGRRRGAASGPQHEGAALHQRITRFQSCSNSCTSDWVFKRFGAMGSGCMSGGKMNISRVVSAFR